MSYKYAETKELNKLSLLPESEQNYVRSKWETLCARASVNNSEYIFFQRPDGRCIEALRGRIAANPYIGSAGGYWTVRYGNCRHWGWKKNPFGMYDAEPMTKYYGSRTFEDGTIVEIPRTVHTKKEVLALAKKLGFEF